jgi:hypothetical protein
MRNNSKRTKASSFTAARKHLPAAIDHASSLRGRLIRHKIRSCGTQKKKGAECIGAFLQL